MGEDRARFEWEGEFPESIRETIREVLTRPAAENVTPLFMVQQLNQALLFRPPPTARELAKGRRTSGLPGATKALPAGKFEKAEETARRTEAQKSCQRLILPRREKEGSDAFLRRLDAHSSVPEAPILPQAPTEDMQAYVKRIVAIREIETPGAVVLPKNAKESMAEFEARLKACKVCAAVVLPRGEHEAPDDFKKRLEFVPKAPVAIMPRSNDEPQAAFATRCKASLECEWDVVVHPYDGTRENHDEYADRLFVQKHLLEQIVEPGNKELIAFEAERLRPKAKLVAPSPAELAAAAPAAAPAAEAAKPKGKTRMQLEEEEMEAAAKAEEEEKQRRIEAGEEEKPKARPKAAPGSMKIGCTHLKEEAAGQRLSEMGEETVDLNEIGFMALKKMMIERGVPADAVNKAPNKFMLKEVAAAHPCKLAFA